MCDACIHTPYRETWSRLPNGLYEYVLEVRGMYNNWVEVHRKVVEVPPYTQGA